MSNKKKLNIFACYIKQHKKNIVLFSVFTIIFALVLYLYQTPISPVLYSALLCVSFAVIYISVDFWNYYKNHTLLEEIKSKIIFDIDQLPSPKNLLEQDYFDLIKTIHDDKIKLISESDNARTDMINYYTIWAHQIKTPIAAMQLLLSNDDSEQNKALLAELFKIEQYVEMVLSYLRLDSNSTDYVIKYYSLDKIVKQSVRKYAPLFIQKKISLDLKEINCDVLTDEKWLSFVIEQILSNALKYTKKCKISIYLTEPKTLVIEDTGIGIASEDLPRIGEKGFTGYNGRTDKKATGLGLYLCKRILTKLSHSIKIESGVGIGTKVFIDLDNVNIIKE